MMQNKNDRLLGLIFVGLGLLVGLEHIQVLDLDLRHWWTLVIIVPCVFNMVNKGINRVNAIGLGLGLALFATAQFAFLAGMLWPIMLLVVGLVLLFIPSRED